MTDAVSSNLSLTGNIKDLKTKQQQSTDGSGNKTTSVFVESVKVYATDDKDQNGKVTGSEIKSGSNASIFDNSNINGESTKSNAFSQLSESAKQIANQNSANALSEAKNKFNKLFDKFNTKAGGEKLKSDGATGVQQAAVTSAQSSYDSQVTSAATSYANDVNSQILQAYSTALQEIAQQAAQEAEQKAEQEAINADLNPAEETSETPSEDETVTAPQGEETETPAAPADEPEQPEQGQPQAQEETQSASMIKDGGTFKVTNAQNLSRPVEGSVSNVEQDESGEVTSFSITTASGNTYSYKRNDNGTYVQLDSQGNETGKKYSLNSETGNLERINDETSSKPAEKKSSESAAQETPAEEPAEEESNRTVLYKTANGDYMTKNDDGEYEYFDADGNSMTEDQFKEAHSTVNTQIQKDKDDIEEWNSDNPNMKVNIENHGKQLSTTVTYGGKKVKVTADSFDDLKTKVQAQLKQMKASEDQRYEYTRHVYKGSTSYANLGQAMQIHK